MNKFYIFLCLFFILIFISAVNATEINNETVSCVDDEVLKLDVNLDNSTDLLSAGEKNIHFTQKNFDSSLISKNSNANFYFSAGTYNFDISSLSNKNFKFIGKDSNVVLCDLHDNNRPTLSVSNSIISFENVKFQYFRFDLSATTLTLNGVEASNINLQGNGGFIYSAGKYNNTVNIYNSTFNNNVVLGNNAGGTIFLINGSLNCYNSNFNNNKGFQAGAIYLNTATSEIKNCNFKSDVSTDKESGAIFIRNSTCNINKSTFDSCSANYGSALTSLSSTTKITGSNFKNNKVKEKNGGTIYAMYGSLKLQDSTFDSYNQIYLDNVVYNNNKNNVNLYKENSNINLINTNIYTPIYSSIINVKNIPSKYDLRDYGFVSSVKNQGIGGNCWSFAALSSLESCILKATGVEYDFSEENLKNLAAKYSKYGLENRETNNGGNLLMSMGYLTSWLGAVNENNDKYCPTSCISPKLNNIINIQNIYLIKPSTNKYDNKNDIKKAILNYGAVVSDYYHNDNYLNGKNYYYGNKNPLVNHGITIVGWDDSYSKTNFKNIAPDNGAWIVKNSWGTNKGDNGYYYISYYDTSIAKITESYTFILNDSSKYNKNYQYDIQKTNSRHDFYYYKNTFTSTAGNEKVVSISSYFDKNINYKIIINVNGVQKYVQNFKTNIDGYFTVKLNQNIDVSNKKFDVVIYTLKKSLAVCSENLLTKKLSNNVSFVSNDGKTWTDSVEKYGFVSCIKAFTTTTSLTARPNLVASDLTKWFGGSEKLTAKLTNGNNNTLKVIINGVTYTRSVSNKVLSMAINLASGNYDAVIEYKDSNFDLKVTVLVTVKSTIVASDVVKYFRNGTQYYATFYDSKGNLLKNTNVQFNINGVFYTRTTDSKGVARLNINLAPDNYNNKTYIITAQNPINSEQHSNNITILSVLQANDLHMYYKDGSKFNVTVLDGAGKPYASQTITININGVLYYRVTNSNGVASLNINLKPGTYIATASYNGLNIARNIIIT